MSHSKLTLTASFLRRKDGSAPRNCLTKNFKPKPRRSFSMSNYNILILGASYGSLLASKILFGGHSVKLVCLPAEAELINSEGFRVWIPVRGRDEQKIPANCRAECPRP